MRMIPTNDNSATNVVDAGAATLWLAAAIDMAPSIAAVLSIIWFVIRIAESNTVQKMLGKYSWMKETKDGPSTD